MAAHFATSAFAASASGSPACLASSASDSVRKVLVSLRTERDAKRSAICRTRPSSPSSRSAPSCWLSVSANGAARPPQKWRQRSVTGDASFRSRRAPLDACFGNDGSSPASQHEVVTGMTCRALQAVIGVALGEVGSACCVLGT